MAKARLEPGATLDGYTLEEQVHKGGMAALWRVTRSGVDEPMLMKVPRLGEGEDPATIVSFEMEQMILPRLRGRHVPRTFAVGDFAVQPYIVMERIAGDTLLPRLSALPLPPHEVADIGARLASALDSLHRQDLIHLDIKPSNVMFRPSGEAVFIDFGLSHHTGLPDLMAEEFHLPYGTAPYMAPEQVMGVRTYRRSDLFALGCLMYFFATAVRPFGDPQSLKGLKERLWRDPAPPKRWRPEIPDWLQEVILRCLEPDPERRHPTAAQLAFDLRHPDQVPLTARATRTAQDGWLTAMRRRFASETWEPARKLATQSKIGSSPIVAVAVDLSQQSDDLADALRQQVRITLESNPDVRVACVNVLKLSRLSQDTTLTAEGDNKHIERLVALRHWAEPLKLAEGAITFHVLEAINPADAILDHARANHVDHIIMGARAESARRNLLGSVSAQVAGHAPCTVSVVRRRQWPDGEADAAGLSQEPNGASVGA